MGKQIILLETNPSDGGLITIRAAFWLPVPEGREVPLPSLAQGAWKNISDEELKALQGGAVVEEVRTFIFPQGLGVEDVHKILQVAYENRREYIAALPAKGQYYGAFFDGSGWSK